MASVTCNDLTLSPAANSTDTLIVSDIHLGLPSSRPLDLLKLLEAWKFERLLVLGDTFHDVSFRHLCNDGWKLMRFFRHLATGSACEVIWLNGNHDRELQSAVTGLLGVQGRESYSWSSGGRRFCALHGDCFDEFTNRNKHLSDVISAVFGWCQTLFELKLVAARHLSDHAKYFDLFGKADIQSNIDIYDRELKHRLSEPAQEFWNGRTLFGKRRINYLTKGLYRYGTLGRSIHLGQIVCRLHGRNPRKMLHANSPWEQREIYYRELDPLFDSFLVRLAMKLPASLYGLGIPPAQFEELMAEMPELPAYVVRRRLRRLFCDFPLEDNYFAHQALSFKYGRSIPGYLEEEHFSTLKERAAGVELQNTSMTNMLKGEEAQSFTSYVLLDAQDWMSPEQLIDLWQQIDRTADIGAKVIFRTAGAKSPLELVLPSSILRNWNYLEEQSLTLHRVDRSAIYGGFHIFQRDN